MSDASSMTRYSAEAFGAVCEEVRYLKRVVESQSKYIESLKKDSGRKETEENLTAQLRDAWEERDEARKWADSMAEEATEFEKQRDELQKALEYSQLALEFLAPIRKEGDIAFAAYEQNKRLLTK